MTKEAARSREIQSFLKTMTSSRFDSILPEFDHGLVNSFTNSLLRFGEVKPPRYELMRDHLHTALASGEKLRSARIGRARLMLPEFQALLDHFLKKAKGWQAEIVREEKAYEKQGADEGLVEVDIVFTFVDFNNELPDSGHVTLDFPASKAKLTSALHKGGCRFKGIMLEPKARVHVEVSLHRKVKPKLANNLVYHGLKKGHVLSVSAAEDTLKLKRKDTSAASAAKRAGTKGTFGVDWKIFTGGAEITREKELTKSAGKEVEYEILVPKGSMSLKQG